MDIFKMKEYIDGVYFRSEEEIPLDEAKLYIQHGIDKYGDETLDAVTAYVYEDGIRLVNYECIECLPIPNRDKVK